MSRQLREQGVETEIVTIRTSGDRGDREVLGAFVREIQEAILQSAVDIGLHCLKDLPTEPVPGLTFAAFLERDDPRDVLISSAGSLSDMPFGAVVGTGSVRRTSQLASLRPDLAFRRLVGNVDTRLRKLAEGEYAAIVLAAAGLNRLGLGDRWSDGLRSFPLDTEAMLPAPGQAILVLETRAEDESTMAAARALDDPASRACGQAERAFLRTFGGGCSVPVGALAEPTGAATFSLRGLVAAPDGREVRRAFAEGAFTDAEAVGACLGERLGREGGFAIVDSVIGERAGVR